eukprot:Nitzschia sp. Nitz4//scaffold33_size148984//82558//83748//NITZ4_002932-RA/size148984-processed-gene-0.170-mRNA-1//-1//CDS//3329548439//1282//frame0
MDPDIPVAMAVPATAVPFDPKQGDQIPTLTKGRSSRVVLSNSDTLNTHELGDYERNSLKTQGFPGGLIDSMMESCQVFPLRFWVVDNSGSMNTGDGHRIVETPRSSSVKFVSCSRWAELQQTVEYHAQLAGLVQARTVFRLLNDPGRIVGPQQFSIGEHGPDQIREEVATARDTMTKTSPSGCTPLALHIREIRSNVMSMLPQLQANGQRVAIVLATDGLPTDPHGRCNDSTKREFEDELRSLVGLPVWIVVRLCTDEDSVVDYYNGLDSQLELSLDILDDWVGEAKEVQSCNPWLTYGLCLHRMREMGFHHRLFDLLDERRFTLDEVREFLVLLLGAGAFDGAPDPNADMKGFLDHVKLAISQENKQWNPVSRRMVPWVDVKRLKSLYGESCVIM